jgi:acetyl-CoA carboxylase biotin carboxyl carrier protein
MAPRQDVTELIGLVDRLERLLERSALSELELEVEGTTVILRTPAAVAPSSVVAPTAVFEAPIPEPALVVDEPPAGAAGHAIVAPLTGVFYRSPSPEAEPYLREGGQVNAGQVIGLIEAMKLFNEIKSDVTGIVRRIGPDDGVLVKAKQTLIEVDPT